MAFAFRNCLGLLLIAFLAMALMDTTVEARSHKPRHRVQRREATSDNQENDDDYLQNDERYDDEILNDADDGDDDGDDEDGGDDDGDSSENDKMLPPIITSKPQNFTVRVGKSVWLPCNALNSENAVAVWRKEDQVFFQGNIQIVKDPRFVKYTNLTMSISDIRKSDAGQYTCSMLGSASPPTVTHEVTLAMAPHIYKISPNGTKRLVREGSQLKIQCHTSGHPTPTITWSKMGARIEHAQHGHQSIFFESVTRKDSGMYQCLASNEIGEDHGAVDIKVLHAPEVHIKETVVNAAEGYEAMLLCSVLSEPRASIYWEKNGVQMKDTKHHPITLSHDGNHSKLRIIKVTATDFGTYYCKANNEFGENSGHVLLSKQPGRAIWIAGNQDPKDNSPVLQWSVASVQPLKDVEIKYFKVDETKPEHDQMVKEEDWIVVKPNIQEPNANIYTVRHALQDLQPGKYAAILRSQNEHGWSEFSQQQMFDGDYESNEIRADENLQEAPMAEVAASAINIQHSLYITAATLLLSMFTISLVRIY